MATQPRLQVVVLPDEVVHPATAAPRVAAVLVAVFAGYVVVLGVAGAISRTAVRRRPLGQVAS